MTKPEFIPDGYCGLYCAACPSYRDTLKDACLAEQNFRACRGCKSETVASWCAICKLKECARGKDHEFCYQCSEYPCPDWNGFKTDPRYPYHTETSGYMKTIKAGGIQTWLAEMQKRWSCSSCGTPFDWWTQTCRECGAPVKGYHKPLV